MVIRGLSHIEGFTFGEFPIQESLFNIDLMEFHIFCSSYGENSMVRSKVSNWGKGIKVINTWHL